MEGEKSENSFVQRPSLEKRTPSKAQLQTTSPLKQQQTGDSKLLNQNKQHASAQETEAWMLIDAEQLHLDDASLQLIRQYKQTEKEIYYTLQYQKQQFPVLPLREEDLFISPFELCLEKCQAQKYEIDWPDLPESDDEEEEDDGVTGDPNQSQPKVKSMSQEVREESSDDAQKEAPQNDFNLSQITTLNVFLQHRNPRELNLQQQPLSLFDMWRGAMEAQFMHAVPKELK